MSISDEAGLGSPEKASADRQPVFGGRYVVLGPLGVGGMSEVLLARDEILGRDVAVKVLDVKGSIGTEGAARFASEARVLAMLSHPALVTLLDADIKDRTPYLVFELVDGTTLAQEIASGPLAPDRVRAIAIDVADGLAYAHERGIVHRDLKPSNILLREDGRTKLADFGIARLVDETIEHTLAGQVVGSPAYLSPEQATGASVTPTSDVYSFGRVLLEALTGDRPPPGTPLEVVTARLSTPVELPPGLVPEWHSLLASMTDRERTRRPDAGAVAALARDLPANAWHPDGTAVLPEHELPVLVEPETVVLRADGVAVPEPVRALVDRVRSRATDYLSTSANRGVAAALAALVVFLVVIAVAGAASNDREPEPAVPDVPAQYQDLVRDLDEAIRGG